MKHYTSTDALQNMCKSNKQWGMFFSISNTDMDDYVTLYEEIYKAAPYLKEMEAMQNCMNGYGYILFESEEECRNIYLQTVGDDGPTKLNNYASDKVRVYALTCNPDGILMSENT